MGPDPPVPRGHRHDLAPRVRERGAGAAHAPPARLARVVTLCGVRLAAVTVLLALVAAGCGGGGGSTAEEQAWADEVCTSIASWRTEVETIATDAATALTEPGATRADLEAAIDNGLDATKTLVEDLRAAVPPDTPEGDEAKAAVEAFLDDVQASDDEVRSALAALPEDAGLAQVIAELSGLAMNLQTTVDNGRALVTELTELGGSLKDAFEDADSCQELREPE
jgi:hypothetical protein